MHQAGRGKENGVVWEWRGARERRQIGEVPSGGSSRSSWRSGRSAEALAGVVVLEGVLGVALVGRRGVTRG